MKLKLKIPTKLTPRQTELIQEFDKAATSTSSGSTASANSTAAECKQTFNIQQAWKRLKDFLGTADDTASAAAKEKKDAAEGKKATAEASI